MDTHTIHYAVKKDVHKSLHKYRSCDTKFLWSDFCTLNSFIVQMRVNN